MFVNDGILEQKQPASAEDQKLFAQMVAALLRYQSLLIADDLGQGKKLDNPFSAKQQLLALWDYCSPRLEPEERTKTETIYRSAVATL
jgi:hypothetical protein